MEPTTPTTIERTALDCIERGDTDAASGEFRAVLATEGEASDGHILSIRGLEVPVEMPLLFGHRSQLMVPTLGTIRNPQKTDGVLRVSANVNTKGNDSLADIRRGINQLIQDGDLKGMSVSWDTVKATRRSELPRTDPHHIDLQNVGTDDPRHFGYLIEQSTAREGSVVAIGADPSALIGRADAASDDTSAIFFRAMARSIESGDRADGMADVALAFADLEQSLTAMRNLGVGPSEVAGLIAGDMSVADLEPYDFIGEGESPSRTYLHRAALESLRSESLREPEEDEQITPTPHHAPEEKPQRTQPTEPAINPAEFLREFRGCLQDEAKRVLYEMRGQLP